MGNKAAPGDVAGLLPWYLNNTLSADEAGAVEDWLRQDPAAAMELAAWQQAQHLVTHQPAEAPPLAVYERVREPVRSRSVPEPLSWLPRLAWGAAVGLAVLVLLWFVFQPGIVLDWSVQGSPVLAFRVYRAPLGTADFGLVGEVLAEPEVQHYRYVDARPWLGWSYEYRVEVVGRDGRPVISHATTAGAQDALPGQVAVLLTSMVAGFAAVWLTQNWQLRAFAAADRFRKH